MASGDMVTTMLMSTRDDMVALRLELAQAKKDILALQKNCSVPVGFIYTELPQQPSPDVLWPGFQWTDVTSTYAGVFFRALGGNSGHLGVRQQESCPMITEIRFSHTAGKQNDTIYLHPQQHTSKSLNLGGFTGDWCTATFTVSGGECRPTNMAVRIWKRTA